MRAILPLAVCLTLSAQTSDEVRQWLTRPLLDPKQPQVEVQVYTASRVPPVPSFRSALEWQQYADQLRRNVLDNIVFRGEAKRWRAAPAKVEWLDTIEGNGYRIRKLRYQVIPGLMAPALLYEPARLTGKVAAVLNVNGHEKTGVATPYIQARCINLARRGMLALNPEWLGRGQLSWEDYNHYRMPQIDLAGSSGLAVFYLAMERALDLLLAHQNADPSRVAVTGLSGGGWQTAMISSLDTRVKAAVPVAGHSSYVTRSQWPELDLGDSEQTPSDLAATADYLHLTAMLAPRPLLLIHNAKDNCCFRADYAMGPLLQASRAVYSLFGALDKLRYAVNHGDGHNYNQDSREELYRFLRDEFHPNDAAYPLQEIPVDSEVRTEEQLKVPLPEGNATFRSIALELARGLPRQASIGREELARVIRLQDLSVTAMEVASQANVTHWRLRMGGSWTVPAVEITPPNARETVILAGDDGRKALDSQALGLLKEGKRVLALDPFYFGESQIASRDFLFAMLIAGLGERPIGLQAGQLRAAALWIGGRHRQPVSIQAHGRRTSLIALLAAATDEKAIAGVKLHGAMSSLRQIIDESLAEDKAPELFCFGLLEAADIPQIAKLVAPRPVRMDP